MTTITISYDVTADKFQQIEQLIASEEINNADFNGEEFNIERGDFTCIDNEEHAYAKLLYKILDIISGQREFDHE